MPSHDHAPFIGNLLLRATTRLRRSRALELLREIESAPFVSSELVLQNQFTRLSKLLSHAETNVPYYRELFQSLGIASRDIRSLKDFAGLPVLTKDIVRERGRDLVRDDQPLSSFLEHNSGGSTGVPLKFYRDRNYIEASEAGTYRNLQQSGWRPGDMVAFFWGGNEKLYRMSRFEFELRQQLRRMYQFDPFHSGEVDMEEWLSRWPKLKPVVALGYASTIARFAEFVERQKQKVSPLRGVFTTAETLYPQQREVISRVFGCRVYDLYGSSEVQNIAAECGRGRMHVNADFVVLETDTSEAVEAKPFLLTSLWNYTMPFIRYRNEDCGDLVTGECVCGNRFPLMDLKISRTSDNFYLPGGSVVHGEFFTHLMYGSDGIASFQFHQTAIDKITLWIVPTANGSAAAREKTIKEAVAQVEALAPGKIDVDVNEVVEIPLSKAGKHRFTRSDVSGPGTNQELQ
jgi:phenylacetate-CoA ligase